MASGLNINAVCQVILREQQIYTGIQAVHSLLYIVAEFYFFSVVTWNSTNSHCHMKSQQIIILHKTNKKITFLVNCWPSGKYVNLLYMYSILGRGSFCFNYCLNLAWHGVDQFVALLRWYRSPGLFDCGLQLICIFWSLFSHFPLDNTTYILSGVQV